MYSIKNSSLSKFSIAVFGMVILSSGLFAQSLTQTVRGTVSDKLSKETLVGATVMLMDSTFTHGSVTDLDGNFKINDVPIGRQKIKITFLGYREIVIPVVVTSGKEVVLNMEMEQSVIQGKEVTIVAEKQKDRANNEMTTVSARSFTIEETSRYAGSLGDPSRMATNYAGVSGANDARNDIIIRGNSSLGLLWRLNGVDIPNPNHFGALGVTGGPVSILNNNTLDKSDFLTGAFPAEYGNAVGGAFDLQMRSGNNEKREFIGQVGFNGFEIGAEGPFSRKGGASYLVNYRYSTLGVFDAIGINFGTGAAIPQYQDVTFRIDLPTESKGKFSLFGIGGLSSIDVLDKDRDTTKENLYDDNTRQDGRFSNTMGVVGLSHTYFFNSTTYGKLTLSASTAGQNYKVDTIDVERNLPIPKYRNNSNEQKYTASYLLSKKFSSKDFVKVGVTGKQIEFSYRDSVFDTPLFRDVTNAEGGSFLFQSYIQWQHKFSDHLSINTGVHYDQFTLNNTYAIEPRFGIRWEMKEGQALSFGTGMHSQLQPLYVYLQKTHYDDGHYADLNKNLEMTKSNHFVLAFDKSLAKDMRIKVEAYYQHIYNVPVEQNPSWFSMLNEGADFGVSSVDSLMNKGTGENYGIEFTWEKFYSKGYYFLVTSSLFDSKYKGSDGIERNTAFNGNFAVNALAGKEWTIKGKNVLGFNVRTIYAGGKRFLPVDFEESQLKNQTEYDTDHAFEQRQKDYFRTDIKVSYRINKKKVTHEIALDIDNVFNVQNVWQQFYDAQANTVKTEYQMGIFPVPTYRLTF